MSEYIQIPVDVAKQIALRFAKSMVIVLAYDPKFECTHTTTYGVSAFDKENAAAAGEIVTKALGADLSKKQVFEDFHRDYSPALLKEAQSRVEELAWCLRELHDHQNGAPLPSYEKKWKAAMDRSIAILKEVEDLSNTPAV